ncbi:MAG TPA: invasion associated locus B family protein [Roseiarcus sp.]|nr:invasion associated locus B family protein [Roseiarcus sp.]
MAIQHPQKGQPLRLVVQVPVNVSLPSNVLIEAGDADPGLSAPFNRCLPVGCFADFDLKDDAVQKFRSATAPGKVMFKDSTERDVAVPLSFKGFGPALDALSKE